MATAPTFEDLFGAARRETLARPTRITPEAIDTDGTDVQIAVAAGAAIGEEVGAYLQSELNATRIATAAAVSSDALEQLGASEYGETRYGAQSAIASVVFTRQTGGPTTIPAGTVVGGRVLGGDDTVICVVNLHPTEAREGIVHLDPAALGLPAGASYRVLDELDGTTYTWGGSANYVRLDPAERPAHVLAVARP